MALKRKFFTTLMFCYLFLSVYLFGAAMYIEVLNYQAGGILPRSSDFEQGNGKWRVAFTGNLKGLGVASENDANEISLPAIPDKEQLEQDRLALAENRLLQAVIKLGMPQYKLLLLSGFLFVLCLIFRPSPNPKMVVCALSISFLLSLISFVFLVIRDYFGSLGW